MTEELLPIRLRGGPSFVEMPVRRIDLGDEHRVSTLELGVNGIYSYYELGDDLWLHHVGREGMRPTVDRFCLEARGPRIPQDELGGREAAELARDAKDLLVSNGAVLKKCHGPIAMANWNGQGRGRLTVEDMRSYLLHPSRHYSDIAVLFCAHDLAGLREMFAEHMPSFAVPGYRSTLHRRPRTDARAVMGAELSIWGFLSRNAKQQAESMAAGVAEAMVIARDFLEARWPEHGIDWRKSSFAWGSAPRQDTRLGIHAEPERDPVGLANCLSDMLLALEGSGDDGAPLLRMTSIRLEQELARRAIAAQEFRMG